MPAQKYTAIYEDLKKKIEEGLYAPQSVLPSENILTTRYGVSRNTIRRAIAQLADESYVQSIHGKGVVVIYRKAQANMFSFDVIAYERTLGDEKLTVYCNLRGYEVPVSGMPSGEILICNYAEAGENGVLKPFEARAIRG